MRIWGSRRNYRCPKGRKSPLWQTFSMKSSLTSKTFLKPSISHYCRRAQWLVKKTSTETPGIRAVWFVIRRRAHYLPFQRRILWNFVNWISYGLRSWSQLQCEPLGLPPIWSTQPANNLCSDINGQSLRRNREISNYSIWSSNHVKSHKEKWSHIMSIHFMLKESKLSSNKKMRTESANLIGVEQLLQNKDITVLTLKCRAFKILA